MMKLFMLYVNRTDYSKTLFITFVYIIKTSDTLILTKISNIQCQLLPEKALFFPENRMLVISDLHIGKIGFFRKNGIPLPATSVLTTIEKLQKVVEAYSPDTVVFLGDLFHTFDDSLWSFFSEVISKILHRTGIILVSGNHDVFPNEKYEVIGIKVCDVFIWNNLCFSHEPQEDEGALFYNIAGHIHPAVRISSRGKQNLRLPCFCIGKSRSLLPSFGHFTGSHTITPHKDDNIFVIGEGAIFSV